LTYDNPLELWASQLSIDELNEQLTDETVSVVYPGLPDKEHDVLLSENGEVVVDGSLGAGDIEVGGDVIVKGTVRYLRAKKKVYRNKRFCDFGMFH